MRSFLLLQTKAFVTEILQNSAIIQINALVNKRKRITKFAFTVLWSDDRNHRSCVFMMYWDCLALEYIIRGSKSYYAKEAKKSHNSQNNASAPNMWIDDIKLTFLSTWTIHSLFYIDECSLYCLQYKTNINKFFLYSLQQHAAKFQFS